MLAREASDQGGRGYIFAVFEERVRCDDAIRELANLGRDMDEVHTFIGDEGAAALEATKNDIDAAQGGGGLLIRLANRLRGVGMAPADAAVYERAAREGQCVLALPVVGVEEREHLGRLMQTHAGHLVRYYGPGGAVEELAP